MFVSPPGISGPRGPPGKHISQVLNIFLTDKKDVGCNSICFPGERGYPGERGEDGLPGTYICKCVILYLQYDDCLICI